MNTSQRFLLLGGVGLVPGRIKHAGPALVAVCDDLDPILKSSGFYEKAPFKRLDGIIRFSTKNTIEPEISPIRDGGLPFSIEVEMSPLRNADKATVVACFRIAVINALLAIGRAYGLPVALLK